MKADAEELNTEAIPFRLRLLQLRCWLLRVRTLEVARRVGKHYDRPFVVPRRFAKKVLFLDLSRSDTHRLIFLEGERALVEYPIFRGIVRPGDVVVDVGANIGYIAVLLSSLATEAGRVVCLEPDPTNLRELQRNIRWNSLQNVQCIPVAASDSNARIKMHSGLNAHVAASRDGDLEVVCRRVDDLELGRVNFVKIDVEGHELRVLHGMQGLLTRTRPTLYIELHPSLVAARDELAAVHDFLRECGYERFRAFAYRRRGSGWRRVLRRYLGETELEEGASPEAWIQEAVRGARSDSFWLLAEGRSEAG